MLLMVLSVCACVSGVCAMSLVQLSYKSIADCLRFAINTHTHKHKHTTNVCWMIDGNAEEKWEIPN